MKSPGRLILVILATAITSAAETTRADDNDTLIVGGVEMSEDNASYALIGAITPLPGSTFGNGYVARIFASRLTYSYKATRRIEAESYGSELSVGFQNSGEHGWWGIYAGPGYRYTDLSPNDPSSEANGSLATVKLQAEGERYLSQDIKANINTSFEAFATNGYWTRARLLWRYQGDIFIGPEAIYQGDDDYDAWSAGAGIFGIPVFDTTNLGFKAGVHRTDGFDLAPYGGIEFGFTL